MKTSVLKEYYLEILIALSAAVISIVLLTVSLGEHGISEKNRNAALMEKQTLNDKIQEALANKNILKQTKKTFVLATEEGFYADEDRLAWADVIKNVAKQLMLPNVKYSIAPQVRIDNVSGQFPPSLTLSESSMTINADLLHEGDFIEITRQFDALAPAKYKVKNCVLKKGAEIKLNELQKNIALMCVLNWYSVRQTPLSETDEAQDEDIDLGGVEL